MNYKQFNIAERHTIDILFNNEKKSITEIAKILKRNKSSVSREVKRNSLNGAYSYEIANQKSVKRSKHKYSFRFFKYSEFNQLFLKYYDKRVHGIKATWNKIKENYSILMPSVRQVFNWIKSYNWYLTKRDRLRRYYKKGGKRSKGIFSKFSNKRVMPIWARPKSIDKREEFGHWEIDFVIGKRASGFANILTFTERKTRVSFIRKVWSKNPMKTNSEIYKLINQYKLEVKSITTDNGIEFEKIGLLAHWVDCLVYYAEPYASYQRGSNEHYNGIFRRFYKKGTNFNDVSEEELTKVMHKINNMPREIFNWKSAYDMYFKN